MCLLPLVACVTYFGCFPVFFHEKKFIGETYGRISGLFFKSTKCGGLNQLAFTSYHVAVAILIQSPVLPFPRNLRGRAPHFPVNGEFFMRPWSSSAKKWRPWPRSIAVSDLWIWTKKKCVTWIWFFFRVKWPVRASDVTTRDCLHKARSPPIDHAKPPPLVSPKFGEGSFHFSCLF